MRAYSACMLAIVLLYALAPSAAADWPQFRGARANGVAEGAAPLEWSEDSGNLKWKVALPGLGWSSPVVVGGRIWLTTATDDGKSLRALCLESVSGNQVLNVEVFQQDQPGRVHAKNSYASPTPIVDKEFVYVHYGAFGTACLNDRGKILWRRKLAYQHVHGPGGSPALYDGKLFINCDGSDVQFVIALEAATGKIIWQTARPVNPNKKFAFSTPTAADVGGTTQIISAGAGGVSSYDPQSGEELWRVDYPEGYSVAPQPTAGEGLVFVSSAFDRASLLAIDPLGSGNITQSHVKWSTDRGAPHTSSPLLVGGHVFLVSDRGVATCLDAHTGEQHWQQRLGGNFSASPLAAEGRVYFLDETGTTTVVAASPEFQELAKNKVTGRTLATPAIVGGSLYLRTDAHLYRFDAEN